MSRGQLATKKNNRDFKIMGVRNQRDSLMRFGCSFAILLDRYEPAFIVNVKASDLLGNSTKVRPTS
jgi:hypothetical protein